MIRSSKAQFWILAALTAAAALPGCSFVARHRTPDNQPTWNLEMGAAEPAKAPELDDAKPLRYFIESNLAANASDTESAIHKLEKAVASDPNSPFLRVRLARYYLRNGNEGLKQAREQLEKAVALAPEDAQNR